MLTSTHPAFAKLEPKLRPISGHSSMVTFIALLRAVNVGGSSTLAMADLKSVCEGMGLADVRTYIQSGNVVFRCDWDEARLKDALETALSTRMGKQIDVFIRSAEEMARILDRNPFASAPGNQVLVLFFDQSPEETALAAITTPGREEIRTAGREAYVHYPDGIGRSKLNLASLGLATARNINTVGKLVAMATG